MGDFSPFPGNRPGPAVKNIYVQGNTTGATSSMPALGPTIFFSGMNLNSVGFSGNAIIFSSLSAKAMTAVGNTVTSSSGAWPITAPTISADGLSIGFSAGTVVFSAPASVGTTVSYFQPLHLLSNQFVTNAVAAQGIMTVQPMALHHALSFNQINFLGLWGFTGTSITSAASVTKTAQVNMTITAAFYTPQTGISSNSYGLFLSTTATMGISESLSISSGSYSKTDTLSYNIGSATSTISGSITSTTATTNAAISNALLGYRRGDIPWATSLPPGSYLFGLNFSTNTTGSALSLSVSLVAAGLVSTTHNFAPLNKSSTNFWGHGSTSVVGSTAPSTIDPSSLSTIASYHRPWFMIRNGGT